MKSDNFWDWFDAIAAPRLSESKTFPRERTFRQMFEHLDGFEEPVIIETGCIEEEDNWVGNGCSTIMFDKYVQSHPRAVAFSIEIVAEKVERARALCPHVHFYQGDSVEQLRNMATWLQDETDLGLLYLDASHHDWIGETPSQVHHFRELTAIMPRLTERSLVVVDDSVLAADDYPQTRVIGKGGLVAQYALEVGARLRFCDYQVGFTAITGRPPKDIDDVETLIKRARKHVEAGEHVAADRLYRLVMIATPPPWTGRARIARGEASAHFARNAARMRRHGTAMDWYRTALEVDPKAGEYRVEMVKSLMSLGALHMARREASIATEVEPDVPQTWQILGDVESLLLDADATKKAYDEQVKVADRGGFDEELSDALLNRSTVALDTEEYDLVEASCAKIMGLKVRSGDALHVMAMLAYRRHEHEKAIELFDRAIEGGCRNEPLAHWNKSLPLHALGRYKEGWAEHAWGEKERTVEAIYVPHMRFNAPKWRGEDATEGQIVHVHTEAGHGDNMAILRYLPLIEERGFKVRYECDPLLVDLVRGSFPTVEVMPRAVDYPGALGVKPFDYHIPIGDIPHVFGTDVDSVPWRGPYLKADPKLAVRYRELPFKGRKVGLCWSSGIRRNASIWMEHYGKSKSMSFDDVMPIVGARPMDHFVSLQVGDGREENHDLIDDLLPARPTWADTAALVHHLDLVVTVDTGVAHLAGAMGKPVFVLMQRDGTSWHFMCYRDGSRWNQLSPWYPSAQVFRQHGFEGRDWSGAVDDVIAALRA